MLALRTVTYCTENEETPLTFEAQGAVSHVKAGSGRVPLFGVPDEPAVRGFGVVVVDGVGEGDRTKVTIQFRTLIGNPPVLSSKQQ